MKLNNFFLFLLVANSLLAQHNTTGKIAVVKESGLYKIVLPAEIRSFSREELSDFRILDAKGTEVPYYITQDERETTSTDFLEFKILSKTIVPKKQTSIIFENSKGSINEIVVSITNSDVAKPYSISGSNDQKDWFGLVNNSQLYELENSNDVSVLKTISLPLTSYQYLRIEFDDKKTLPINVLKIGSFTNKVSSKNGVEIFAKKTKIVPIPAEKKTRIYIGFHYPEIINQISFNITGPGFYQRNARIYVNKKRPVNQKGQSIPEIVADFQLNSNQKNVFAIPQLFEKEFYVEIENKDSQPLNLDKIQFFQNPIAVIADLKANEKYTIQTGNQKLQSPEYDLEYFKSNIDKNLPEARIYDIQHLSYKEMNTENKSFWQQSWFMWICIGLGGIAIAFFATSLVRDMKNNSSV